jgi:hypothetical protein
MLCVKEVEALVNILHVLHVFATCLCIFNKEGQSACCNGMGATPKVRIPDLKLGEIEIRVLPPCHCCGQEKGILLTGP